MMNGGPAGSRVTGRNDVTRDGVRKRRLLRRGFVESEDPFVAFTP
jgi:hypothetical protein